MTNRTKLAIVAAVVALAAVATLIVVALSPTSQGDHKATPEAKPAAAATPSTAPIRVIGVGDTAKVTGISGHPTIELTLAGVAYPGEDVIAGANRAFGTDSKPSNGQYLVARFEAKATTKPDSLTGGVYGGGFAWRGVGSKEVTEMDGEASNPPWAGAVPLFGAGEMQPGEVNEGYVTLDVYVRGGEIRYFDPAGKLEARWKLPTSETGKLPELDKAIAKFQ